MSDFKFYVYVHKKPCGTVFYVGKGCGKRHLSKRYRSEHWHRIVEKYGYSAEIVSDNLKESDAFRLEVELIAEYGMDSLCNHTGGGDGVSGYRHTPECRKLFSKIRTGAKHSAETRKKMSDWHKANCKPPHLGKNLTEEHRRKVGEGVRGESNGRYNHSKYVFTHPEHGSVVATQNEIVKSYGLHHGAVSGMASGKVKSVKGWRIESCQD